MNKEPVEERPFIAVREVIPTTVWGGWIKASMPIELRRQFFMPFWTKARLRRHLEMLKAFGFNSIQMSNPTAALWVGADLQEWRKKQVFMCRTAHELGMSTSQFVWGAAVTDVAQGGQQLAELDWHKPEERARLEASYREQAQIAPYVDRVITHWADPGGPRCEKCSIDTIVEMHNAIMAEFRAKNPKVHGALSLWFVGPPNGRWPGFKDPGTLAASKVLDADTDIVLGLLNYHADGVNLDGEGNLKAADLGAIAAAGRHAGVWGWYTADVEIQAAMHVRTDVLDNYFRSLPPETHTQLAWHSIDDNFTGLNMQNLYVAGKLMQDPSLDAQALLDEFTRGLVGKENARPVATALRAIEQARTRSLFYSAKVQDAVAPKSPTKGAHTPLPADWLETTAQAVVDAKVGLQNVKLAADFKPAWPVTMEPAMYIAELKAHLEAVYQMLAFIKAARDVERLQASGVSGQTIRDAIGRLPKVEYDPAHTAGLEADIYKQKLAALRNSAGLK